MEGRKSRTWGKIDGAVGYRISERNEGRNEADRRRFHGHVKLGMFNLVINIKSIKSRLHVDNGNNNTNFYTLL
jgi:hypothetical protein